MHDGEMPPWLSRLLSPRPEARTRLEIEVKLLLPRDAAAAFMQAADVTRQTIRQIYLPFELVGAEVPAALLPPDPDAFDEWRIRRLDDERVLTAKCAAGDDAAQRREYETAIPAVLFERLEGLGLGLGGLDLIAKTRYSRVVELAQQPVLVQVDEYHAAAGKDLDLDFVTCEVEVPDLRLAHILRGGRFFARDLQFLHRGTDLTGIKSFGNRCLSRQGFPAPCYAEVLVWLRRHLLDGVGGLIGEAAERGLGAVKHRVVALLDRIQCLDPDRPKPPDAAPDTAAVQDVLSDLAFSVADSLGRAEPAGPRVAQLDAMGKGWLRDYHVIVSSNPFLRLHSKPQIFRPGVGHTNTTTRGAHTHDVIAASMQLARQLGLNAELCAAIAALHDIGHPAGGHVGEEILFKLSGRHFKHNVFALSLADIFGFNLLHEVQVGAFYHKSGGRKLMAPVGRPQEYGIVRVADKICYAPWDLFDSMTNGYLRRDEVPERLFEVLGETPLEWIQTLIEATVRESAEANAVALTERSGRVYEVFQEARTLVFEQVHRSIRWELLWADMTLCYEAIAESFAGLDPVALVAYMTDTEVARVARMAERLPRHRKLTLVRFEEEGLGVSELIERLGSPDFQPSRLYYTSAKEALE
jgi:hypothetical protein